MPSRWRRRRAAVFLFFLVSIFFLALSPSLSLSLESEESEESEEEEEEEEEEVEASEESEESLLLSSLLLELLELLLPLPTAERALCLSDPWSNARSHHASPQSVAGTLALLAPT